MKLFLPKLCLVQYSFLFVALSLCQTPVLIQTCDTILDFSQCRFCSGKLCCDFKSPTNRRLAYSINYFNSNYGNINIYDGLNTGAPLITVLGDPFSIPNQPDLWSIVNRNCPYLSFSRRQY